MFPGGSRRDRGQTGLDYLVGIGVFLLTVGFVLAFVPGTLEPFTDGTEQPIVADRAADTIVAGLADGPEPNVLNGTCTDAFFDSTNTADCGFDNTKTTDADALPDELGLSAFTRVNVTLERSVTGTTTRAVLYVTGAPVPTNEPVVTATRTVYVDGKDAVVVVRVW